MITMRNNSGRMDDADIALEDNLIKAVATGPGRRAEALARPRRRPDPPARRS